jgi:ribosomal protein S18 acetylase RimI-like enzyme
VSIATRAAEPAEYDEVARLTVAAYAPFLSGTGTYEQVLRDVAGRAAHAEVLVAVDPDSGALLGTVTFVPEGGRYGEIAQDGEAEFRMLAVDPAAQGRGVGAVLLAHVLEESRRRGKHGVVCSSQPSMTAAHRVYERAGMRRAPERDWSPLPGVDLQAFAVALTA